MGSRVKRRSVKSNASNGTNGHGPGEAARALKELRTIGGLLVRSSVALTGDAADQFVWMGRQIQTRADQAIAALATQPPPSTPRRRPRA